MSRFLSQPGIFVTTAVCRTVRKLLNFGGPCWDRTNDHRIKSPAPDSLHVADSQAVSAISVVTKILANGARKRLFCFGVPSCFVTG